MGGGKRKAERADARGGSYVMLPHCLLASEAYRAASARAVKLLLALCQRHNGFNNGHIAMSARDIAEALDCQNHAANSAAMGELIGRGLIELVTDHPRGKRLAREYRLTFVATGDRPAANDYLQWKRGDAGTVAKRTPNGNKGNFRVATTTTRSALRVAMAATGEEISRCDGRNSCNAKLPILRSPPVAMAATHILNHRRVQQSEPTSPSNSHENTGGPNSASPDADELRERVRHTLDCAERGSQGVLAALAAIRPAALSKFLNEYGSLNDAARIRLTCALPRIAANPETAAAR